MRLILSAVQWNVFQDVSPSAIVGPPCSITLIESQQQLIWQPGVANAQVGEALQLLQQVRYVEIEVNHSIRKEAP